MALEPRGFMGVQGGEIEACRVETRHEIKTSTLFHSRPGLSGGFVDREETHRKSTGVSSKTISSAWACLADFIMHVLISVCERGGTRARVFGDQGYVL